ncbi:hypothetical protein UFOVP75_172 [uncultured Caudovirales phage]|uniref:Uncharacterized protein n=1 Tax=uncultured Caudovirales phage TaxID=2100421 RepID=A0A6J5L676_9CAUD|nr:hypothetical protein UFOVP75_172 [uncultured Caudovirales phage]
MTGGTFSTQAHYAYEALKATCREQVNKIEALEKKIKGLEESLEICYDGNNDLLMQLNDRNEKIQALSHQNDTLLQELHSVWQMTGSQE